MSFGVNVVDTVGSSAPLPTNPSAPCYDSGADIELTVTEHEATVGFLITVRTDSGCPRRIHFVGSVVERLVEASGYRSALRHRDLRLLLGGQVISMTGTWGFNVALLAYVYERTHSLGWVGAAAALRVLPGFVLSPYGGVVAERFERRRLMIVMNLVCFCWQGCLTVVAVAHGSAVLAIVLAVLTVASSCAYEPAVAATLPAASGESDLPAANALAHTIENLVVLAGPALGALVVAAASPAVVFGANAVSFLIAAALVGRIGLRSSPVDVTEEGAAGLRSQLAVGVRAITGSLRLTILVGGTAVTSFLYGTDTVQLVGVAAHRLAIGASGYGWLLAAMGLGGVLAAPAINRISEIPAVAPLIAGGLTAMGVPTLLLLVVRQPLAACGLEVFRGAGELVVDVLATIALQRSVPPDQLARVFGVLWAVVIGAITLGAALTAPVIHWLGLAGSLWITGLLPLVVTAGLYPTLRRIDAEVAPQLTELEPRIEALAAAPIFAGTGPQVLERLARASSEVNVKAGAEIVCQGQPADALYVILSGTARVWTRRPDGGGRTVGQLRAGSIFGEIGVLQRVPRTATVTAEEACSLLRIDGDDFLEALSSDPLAALVQDLARRRLAETQPPSADLEPAV